MSPSSRTPLGLYLLVQSCLASGETGSDFPVEPHRLESAGHLDEFSRVAPRILFFTSHQGHGIAIENGLHEPVRADRSNEPQAVAGIEFKQSPQDVFRGRRLHSRREGILNERVKVELLVLAVAATVLLYLAGRHDQRP